MVNPEAVRDDKIGQETIFAMRRWNSEVHLLPLSAASFQLPFGIGLYIARNLQAAAFGFEIGDGLDYGKISFIGRDILERILLERL